MSKLLLKDTASLLQRGKRTEELEKKKKHTVMIPSGTVN